MGAGTALMDPMTVRALLDAGWRPGRRVNSTPSVEALQTAGYSVWPDLRPFIEQFGDLTVHITRNGRPDAFWFDPSRAIRLSFRSWVEEYEGRVGSPLVPVGYAHHDHLLVLVAADGRWFGGYDDVFGLLGQDAADALDALVGGQGLRSFEGQGPSA